MNFSGYNYDYDGYHHTDHDYDHLSAVIFSERDEKERQSYEECDTKVDMSWAEHSEPFFYEDEYCIIQKVMITNAVREVKQYSYHPYKILARSTIVEVQKIVEDLNLGLRDEKSKSLYKTCNGCSMKNLSYLWGILDGNPSDRNSAMIEIRPDGNHVPSIDSDPYSVNIIVLGKYKDRNKDKVDKGWTKFECLQDSVMLPERWSCLSSNDFALGLRWYPRMDQVATPIDLEKFL